MMTTMLGSYRLVRKLGQGGMGEVHLAQDRGRQSCVEPGLRLAAALGRFWSNQGYWTEGRQHLAAALERAGEDVPESLRAAAFTSACVLALYENDVEQARHLGTEARDLYEEVALFQNSNAAENVRLTARSLAERQALISSRRLRRNHPSRKGGSQDSSDAGCLIP